MNQSRVRILYMVMNDGVVVGSVKASYNSNGVMHNTETYAGIASKSYWTENYEHEPLAVILNSDTYLPSAGNRGLSIWLPRKDMPFATEWTDKPTKASVATMSFRKGLKSALPLYDILHHLELDTGRVDGTLDMEKFKAMVLSKAIDTTNHESGEEPTCCNTCEAGSSGSREKDADSSPCEGALICPR